MSVDCRWEAASGCKPAGCKRTRRCSAFSAYGAAAKFPLLLEGRLLLWV